MIQEIAKWVQKSIENEQGDQEETKGHIWTDSNIAHRDGYIQDLIKSVLYSESQEKKIDDDPGSNRHPRGLSGFSGIVRKRFSKLIHSEDVINELRGKDIQISLCSHDQMLQEFKSRFLLNLDRILNDEDIQNQELLVCYHDGEALIDFTGSRVYWKKLRRAFKRVLRGHF